jgi:DNA-binding Lrp family transcriptional regulator
MRKQLSESDLEILSEVQKYGLRTFSELRATALSDYDRAYAWRKMRKLVDEGLLKVIPDSSGGIAGWRMVKSRRTIDRYPEASEKIFNRKSYKYQTNFAHDLEVRWVCDQLEKMPATQKIITESQLRSDLFKEIRGYSKREMTKLLSRIPDAYVELKKNGYIYQVALEIELSQKSSERLCEKLEHYISKSGYDLVLYICGTSSIYSQILRQYQSVMASSPAVKFADQKAEIYVCLLSDLKADFMKVNFKSLDGDFSMDWLQPESDQS